MERCISMIVRRFGWLFVLFVLLESSNLSADTTRTLVLATGANSKVPALSIQEARKLFLGVPLVKEGENPVAILNTSDPLAFQIFLQKIAFMSEHTYEAQTMSVVFRLGGKRPENYSDLNALIDALLQTPGAVTYLWEDQIRSNQGLKSVGVLWQGSPE
ncbi:MAG: hypothetical protein IPN42_08505 [Methylococcaceae bacterium]|nr:hypothetical protein [Methylococcaceae bacterium]